MTCNNNSTTPGAPEFGKGFKIKNNSGCGCNGAVKTKTCSNSTTVKTTGCQASLVVSSGSVKVCTSRASRLSVAGCTNSGTNTCCDKTTEKIGDNKYAQRSKIVIGDAGVDGGDVSATNPLPVTIEGGVTGENLFVFGDATLIPSFVETTVVSYIVPADKTVELAGFIATADADVQYRLYVNGVLKVNARSTVANLNVDLSFAALHIKANSSEVIAVKLYHEYAGLFVDSEGTLLMLLQ